MATETYALHLIEDEEAPGTWDVSLDGRPLGSVYRNDTWRFRASDAAAQARDPGKLYTTKVQAAWALASCTAH